VSKTGGWRIEIDPKARKWLKPIPAELQNRILARLWGQPEAHRDPRKFGKPLIGSWNGCWAYRIGDYRVIAELVDDRLVVMIVRVGHRRDIYDR
jgi:mRNA interferase RelE/StbE